MIVCIRVEIYYPHELGLQGPQLCQNSKTISFLSYLSYAKYIRFSFLAYN